MILYLNYNMNDLCKRVLQGQLDNLNLNYSLISTFEIEIKEPIDDNEFQLMIDSLRSCSIEIVQNKSNILVQKIKDTIVEMVFMEEKIPLKASSYLADKLNYSYTYLANLFSSVTYTSIETFIQLQKTERAKQLLASNEFIVTEVSWMLNYSSTAHFSNSFKKVTGMTPTAFLRIIKAKRQKVEL